MAKHVEKVTEKNDASDAKPQENSLPPREIGGFKDKNLQEPTRYGDWEVNGRCSDF